MTAPFNTPEAQAEARDLSVARLELGLGIMARLLLGAGSAWAKTGNQNARAGECVADLAALTNDELRALWLALDKLRYLVTPMLIQASAEVLRRETSGAHCPG